jgi:SAM-dependent methyltransferase
VCGAGVTFPLVSDEQLAGFYPEQYGPYGERMSAIERLVSRAIRWLQGRSAFRAEPLSALRDRRAARGLDVGCGRGDLAALLVGRGWSMTGVEPSPAACAAAASRGVDARCGTLLTVPLEPGAYDAVVFQHSLEHINDPVGALRMVAAALAPGGLVLITVPNFGGWQSRRFGGFWFHLDLPRHRVHFGRRALERALGEAQLEVVSISTSSSAVGLPASLQYRTFGRCLFPGGLGLRVASGLCTLVWPLAMLLDRTRGGGDLLHAVGRRR